MAELRRKIDKYLVEWKNSKDKKPLIIKGARQIGKTTSIKKFGNENYKSFIEINYVSMPQFTKIFQDGYTPDKVIKNMSLLNNDFKFIPGETLLFFDETKYPFAANCLPSGRTKPIISIEKYPFIPRCALFKSLT